MLEKGRLPMTTYRRFTLVYLSLALASLTVLARQLRRPQALPEHKEICIG
jgi:hypothetical protein